MQYTAAVTTIGDKGPRGERTDTSGPSLVHMLEGAGYHVVHTAILPDEQSQIQQELIRCADERQVSLVLTTGGTGRMAQGMMNGSVEQSAANLGLLAKIYAQESGDASLIQETIATGERERRESPEGEAAGDEKEYEEFKELLEENAPQRLRKVLRSFGR